MLQSGKERRAKIARNEILYEMVSPDLYLCMTFVRKHFFFFFLSADACPEEKNNI